MNVGPAGAARLSGMSEHVSRIRTAYEAFSRGDLDGALAPLDENIVWHQAQGLPHGGVYHGLEEVRRVVFDPIEESWWDGFDARPETFLDGGDAVVVLGRYTATAKATGRPLDVPFVHVWEVRDGRVAVFRQFTDTYGWRAALG